MNNSSQPGESSSQYKDSLPTQPLSSEGLSDVQEMVLAILPIPSAVLSIFGSACIIYMSLQTRDKEKWTPYFRLLMGMSMCDIISSMTLAVAAFLRPRENDRVWTFGSEATCSAIGMLTQFSYSGLFYNSMLSLYFLLSTLFKMKNEKIAKRFEPFMHFLSLGFPFATALLGAIMGFYSTTTFELGCWVNDYPRGCIGDECASITIGWYYFGMPFLMSLAIIGISNVSILLFVRRKTRPKRSRSMLDLSVHSKSATERDVTIPHSGSESVASSSIFQTSSSQPAPQDSQDGSFRTSLLPALLFTSNSFRKQYSGRTLKSSFTNVNTIDSSDVLQQQTKRLRLVLSQALLFVASYIFTAGWLGLLRIIESMAETPEDELRMVVKVYPLMVINALMAPLQGFFNMLVFIRPKYLKRRSEYPGEKRLWVFRRCVIGQQVKPTIRYVRKPPVEPETTNNNHTELDLMKSRKRQCSHDDDRERFQDFLDEDRTRTRTPDNEKVVDNTPNFYVPRNMVSTLTDSGLGEDDLVDHGDDGLIPEGRWLSSPKISDKGAAAHRNHLLNSLAPISPSRVHSSLLSPSSRSSLEVISEISASHGETSSSESAVSSDEDDDHDTAMMMDLEADLPINL